MSQTSVFTVAPAVAAALEARLRQELPADAEWRRVDHARFAVKSLGVSLVCYRSGKLVVQGKDVATFVARFLDGAASAPAAAPPALAFTAPTIGSDEAGKGDYFGPLVVAAVHAEPRRAPELQAIGVADSKTLSDQRMFPMAEHIERNFRCAVRVLMPPEYNERWRADGNVNHVLADLHVDAIAELFEGHPDATVVVDRFAAETLLSERLHRRLGRLPTRLVQVARAEAHPVVAAASVVARVRFLEGLAQCATAAGTDLHKGAGEPVDVAAARVFRIGGADLLQQVAKLHFRNSERIAGLRP